MILKFIYIFTSLLFGTILSFSQFGTNDKNKESTEPIPFDAVVFKNQNIVDSLVGRIDVFMAVPYQLLDFSEKDNYYHSVFNVVIRIFDSTNKVIKEDAFMEKAYAETYYDAQGGNGGFRALAKRYSSEEGVYRVEVSIQDEGGRQLAQSSKTVSIPDYTAFDTALSGILLVSQISEANGKLKITPHLSDNIYELQNGLNILYQVYSESMIEAFVNWEIETLDGEKVLWGNQGIKSFGKGETQERIYIPRIDTLPIDRLIFSVTLNKTGEGGDILAKADRNIDNIPSFGYTILSDLEDAINKLALIAPSSRIDSIESLKNERERRAAFFDFWDSQDPSPNTRKNEAFDEYYSRIEYANSQFSTYAEGWLTDMGRIYVVLGPPNDVNSRTSFNTQINEQVWSYNNIGSFVFRDSSGFGDYRLVQPIGFRRKYKYGDADGY